MPQRKRNSWPRLAIILILGLGTFPFSLAQANMPSSTYSETLAELKAWNSDGDDDALSALFALGDLRTPDLVAASHQSNPDIAAAASLVLELLGSPECGGEVAIEDRRTAISCGHALTEADFHRLERLLRPRDCEKNRSCTYKDAPAIDDSLIYALILDGSARSESLLRRAHQLEQACGEGEQIEGELLGQAESMTASAKGLGRDLRLEPANFEGAIRASAFFLSPEYRERSEIKLLARNSKNDRMLFMVSYTCGMLCGRGCYVVLQKSGSAWQYAIIRMAWIS